MVKMARKEPKPPSRPAVFLDRDGTIIEDRGHLSQTSQVVFFEEAFEALRRLNSLYELFIVTNQSGVGKGEITLRDVERVNCHLKDALARQGIRIAAIYVCPHQRDEGCHCIKPNPFFLRQAEADFSIDLRRSFVIGDHPHDVETAANAGATGIYLLSGHGRKHRDGLPDNTIIVEGIAEAVDWIEQARRGGVLAAGKTSE